MIDGAGRDKLHAALLLAMTAAAAVGWTWADDKPRAGAALAFALALVTTAMFKAASGRLTGYVCTYGIGYQASGLACVAWYPALSSREVGVCDEGTGLPVGLLYCVGALLVAAELISTGRRS